MTWPRVAPVLAAAVVAGTISHIEAAGITAAPFTEAAAGARGLEGRPPVESRWERIGNEPVLLLAKNVATRTTAVAGARTEPVRGIDTTGLTISFRVIDGLCAGDAPRFEIQLAHAGLIALGCADAEVLGSSRRFVAGRRYGNAYFPTGDSIERMTIVLDVGPAPVLLRDIRIGESRVTPEGAD